MANPNGFYDRSYALFDPTAGHKSGQRPIVAYFATILAAQAMYSVIAEQIGLNVKHPSHHKKDVLMIPRFDRQVVGGGVIRLGQESILSAANIAELAYLGLQEQNIDVIQAVSTEPILDIAEYVKREIANQALGNSDNHGRNTALSKGTDRSVRLSPLFDIAPMRLAPESIARSTRWGVMLNTHSDHLLEPSGRTQGIRQQA